MEWYEYSIPGVEFTVIQLIIALLVIAVGVVIGRMVSLSAKKVLTTAMSNNSSYLLQRIVNYFVIIVAVLAALSYLHVDFTGALLAGGFLGIIIGFATQSVVANFISGFFLQIEKPFAIGDPIKVIDSDIQGVVTAINVFSTNICSFDGVNTRIPNEKLFTSKILNYSKHVARRIIVDVGISYKEDVSKVIDIIKKKLDENPFILSEPEPLVYLDDLGDYSLKLSIHVWAPSSVWFKLKTQIVQEVKEALDLGGVEIPFAQRVMWRDNL